MAVARERRSVLVRKQYYVLRAHVAKLELLARRAGPGVTAADVVHRSIDAYDPDLDEPSEDELAAAVRVFRPYVQFRGANRRLVKGPAHPAATRALCLPAA